MPSHAANVFIFSPARDCSNKSLSIRSGVSGPSFPRLINKLRIVYKLILREKRKIFRYRPRYGLSSLLSKTPSHRKTVINWWHRPSCWALSSKYSRCRPRLILFGLQGLTGIHRVLFLQPNRQASEVQTIFHSYNRELLRSAKKEA